MIEEMNQEIDGMIETQDQEEGNEIEMKDIEVAEMKIMVIQEPKDLIMVKEAMATAGREEVHEVAARRLLAKGSLL